MTERLNMLMDDEDAQRLDRLRTVIYENDGSQRARGLLSRADAARLALVEGLAVLESRYGVTEPDFADCDLEG